ncbi:putative kelch domain-containing protein 3 isoform X2 [Diplonema papillatum]|nr:putative kelch domain-containing protein 3 isoform X2 [Diplonema papillatum]
MKSVAWNTVCVHPFGASKEHLCLEHRRGHVVNLVTPDGRLVLFGGRTVQDVSLTDVYGLDFSKAALTEPATQPAHCIKLDFVPDDSQEDVSEVPIIQLGDSVAKGSFHSVVSALHGHSLFLFGGFASPSGGNLPFWDQHFYELQLATLQWRQLCEMPLGDPRRRGHTAVTHAGFMYIHGGWGPEADWWRTDLDCFDFKKREWSKVATKSSAEGPAVAFHTAVCREASIIVFGGFVDESAAFTASSPHSLFNKEAPVGPPLVVALHNNSRADLIRALSPDEVLKGRFGEAGSKLYTSQAVWTFDLKGKTWQRQTCVGDVPSPRAHHSATMYEHLMIVIGGECTAPKTDIHILDTNLWLWVSIPVAPKPEFRPLTGHVAFIAHKSLVLFGGTSLLVQYNKTEPNKRPPTEPSVRCFAAPVSSLVKVFEARKSRARQLALRPPTPSSVSTTSRGELSPTEISKIVSRLRLPPKSWSFSLREVAPDRPRLSEDQQTQVLDRLYEKTADHRKIRDSALERRYLKPLNAGSPTVPLSKFVQKFYTDAVRHKEITHESLLSKNITTWKGIGQNGQWTRSDWKKEEAQVLRKLNSKNKAGEHFSNNADTDKFVAKFYEERKPHGVIAMKKSRALFAKHNEAQTPGTKLSQDMIQQLNDRFYTKGVETKKTVHSAKLQQYTSATDPVFKTHTTTEWEATVNRLNQPKPS